MQTRAADYLIKDRLRRLGPAISRVAGKTQEAENVKSGIARK
jgi:hypothetical protein